MEVRHRQPIPSTQESEGSSQPSEGRGSESDDKPSRPTRATRARASKKRPAASQEEDYIVPLPAKEARRKPPVKSASAAKGRVPLQIKINRVEIPSSSLDSDKPKATVSKKRRVGGKGKNVDDELDFDFGSNDENVGNRAATKKGSTKKATVAPTKKRSGATGLKVRR
jgi:hypothetical protein